MIKFPEKSNHDADWVLLEKRILKINILVDGSKAKTSPSITCLKQVTHETVLPIEKHSLTPAIAR